MTHEEPDMRERCEQEARAGMGNKCPDCDGDGWYIWRNKDGEQEQIQCQRCNCTGEIEEASDGKGR